MEGWAPAKQSHGRCQPVPWGPAGVVSGGATCLAAGRREGDPVRRLQRCGRSAGRERERRGHKPGVGPTEQLSAKSLA
jgi:hypothetical protein